jgi:hypothetical protein
MSLVEYIKHVYYEMDGLFSINDIQAFMNIGYKKGKEILKDLERLHILGYSGMKKIMVVSLDEALKILNDTKD